MRIPKVKIGKAASNLGRKFGQNAGEFTRDLAKGVTSGGMGAVGGVAQGLTEGLLGSRFGGPLGKIAGPLATGSLIGYGLNKLNEALSLTDYITEGAEGRKKKIQTEEERKYRSKIGNEVTGGISEFTEEDLDDMFTKSDEGWRSSTESINWDEYSKVAAESVRSNDPRKVWDMLVRNANKEGKSIKTNKPLFLPNTFEKNGKKYAYAIDAKEKDSKGQIKLRFVPVLIGGGAFPDEE
jgi:hypothetical protein